MTTTPQPKERIKVWRPQGFAGVEVELFENISEFNVPLYFMDGFYEITVARGPETKLHYMNTDHRFDAHEDLFLIQHPGETVGATALDEKPLTARTLRLHAAAIDNIRESLQLSTDTPYFPSSLAPESINAPLAKFASEALEAFDVSASHLECESRLLGLMYTVIKHLSDTPPPEIRLGKEPKAVTLIKDALHSAPELEVTLDDLSSLTGLNKFYLGRVFSKEVGISPHQYQLGLRVQQAKDKLARGETLADIAFDTGFADQAHFTRVFKRFTLTTPGRFQRDTLSS